MNQVLPILIAILCVSAPLCKVAATETSRPNIVFVITDDQGWDQLGCNGHPVLKTPHIDRIAHEGAAFNNFFVGTPLCSPSRASFLTGLYLHQHRVINNEQLGLDIISHTLLTFPRQLRENGYETALVGKWHMGLDDSRRPGFDTWISFKNQGVYIDGVVNDNGIQRQLRGNMTDYLNRRAVEFVAQPREKPFCLYLAHKAVHGPFLPAERHEDLYSDYEVQLPPRNETDSVPTWQAVRTQEWKYIHYLESESFDELYHPESDPRKLDNLVNDPKHEAQLEAMRAQLAKMLRESR